MRKLLSSFVRAVIMAVGVAIVATTTMNAQSSVGALRGVVKDAQGVIPGASVQLVNEANGTQRETVTNEVGEYSFPGVQPGTYTLKISMASYSKYERKGLRIGTQDNLVEEPIDGAGEEVAYGDVELAQTVVLAPLLLVLVVVPQILQLAAERVDGGDAVEIARGAEPVAVQFQVREPVSQTGPDRASDGQRGELRVPRIRLGGLPGQRHPPRSMDVGLAHFATRSRHGSHPATAKAAPRACGSRRAELSQDAEATHGDLRANTNRRYGSCRLLGRVAGGTCRSGCSAGWLLDMMRLAPRR